ncbi:MAG: MerR family transcriptional regulator [Kofleriaceae bacterium]
MDTLWTLSELVAEVAARIAALPAPKNGQVRAVPDDRTVRYYGTIGLLDRPAAMRGRTALYGRRHLAQVVAIKRLQSTGRSLAEIQQLWPTLDDRTLARMSGVSLPSRGGGRREFWKRSAEPQRARSSDSTELESAASRALEVDPDARANHPVVGVVVPARESAPPAPMSAPTVAPAELRFELAPNVTLAIAMPDGGVALSPADLRAVVAAAAPLITELANRGLTPHAKEEDQP